MDELNSWKQKALFSRYPSLVKKSSEGVCLTEQPQPQQGESGVISTSIVIIFFLYFLWWLFLLYFVIIFIGVLLVPSIRPSIRRSLRGIRDYILVNLRLLQGELLLPRHPLQLGEESRLKFRRGLKNKAKLSQQGTLILTLYCVERVQYNQGTDIETDLRIIWQSKPVTSTVSVGADTLTLSSSFIIPKHLPPSFESENNQIRWVASVEQIIPKLASHVFSNFTFIVDPVVQS